jgi:pimeloyl-ACP methyl ester carboxylesterase
VSAAPSLTVLVHGLWVHGVLMQAQRRALQRSGFEAVCYSYPTVRLTLTENAARLARFARSFGATTIHWVGHSLGGLVIVRMLDMEKDMAPGRVVLEGVPYRGSAAGRTLAASALGARALGRSMKEWLETHPPGPCGREVAVIAGTLGLGLGRLITRALPVPNDGTVAVEETEVPAATDRIVLPVSHMSMLVSPAVARQICAFLREGRFQRETA